MSKRTWTGSDQRLGFGCIMKTNRVQSSKNADAPSCGGRFRVLVSTRRPKKLCMAILGWGRSRQYSGWCLPPELHVLRCILFLAVTSNHLSSIRLSFRIFPYHICLILLISYYWFFPDKLYIHPWLPTPRETQVCKHNVHWISCMFVRESIALITHISISGDIEA